MCTLRTWTVTVSLTSFRHHWMTTPLRGTRTTDNHHQGGLPPTSIPVGRAHAPSTLRTWMVMATSTSLQPLRVMIPSHGTQTADSRRHRLPRPTFPTRQMVHETYVPLTWTEMEISTLFQHLTRTARLHGTKTTAKQHRGPMSWTSSRMLLVLNRSMLLIWIMMATSTLFQVLHSTILSLGTKTMDKPTLRGMPMIFQLRTTHVAYTLLPWTVTVILKSSRYHTTTTLLRFSNRLEQERGPTRWSVSQALPLARPHQTYQQASTSTAARAPSAVHQPLRRSTQPTRSTPPSVVSLTWQAFGSHRPTSNSHRASKVRTSSLMKRWKISPSSSIPVRRSIAPWKTECRLGFYPVVDMN